MDSGSDPEVEDEFLGADSGEIGNNGWRIVENRKRKKNWSNSSETDSVNGTHMLRRKREKFKVTLMMKFDAESVSIVNPLKLSKAIKEKIGLVESVKKLRDGRLIIYCKEVKQQKVALGIKSIMGQNVICSVPEEKKWVKGVITGISTDVSVEKIKDSREAK